MRYYLFGSRIPNGIAYYDCAPGSSPPMNLMHEADVVLRVPSGGVSWVTKNRFGTQEVKRLNPPNPAEMQPIQSWDVSPPILITDEPYMLPELLVIDATTRMEAAEKASAIYAEQYNISIDVKDIDVRPATTWQDDENPYDLPECIVDPMDDIKKAHDEMLLLREKILRSFEGQVVVTGRPIGVRQKRIVIADNEVEFHYQGSEMTSGPNIVGVINPYLIHEFHEEYVKDCWMAKPKSEGGEAREDEDVIASLKMETPVNLTMQEVVVLRGVLSAEMKRWEGPHFDSMEGTYEGMAEGMKDNFEERLVGAGAMVEGAKGFSIQLTLTELEHLLHATMGDTETKMLQPNALRTKLEAAQELLKAAGARTLYEYYC